MSQKSNMNRQMKPSVFPILGAALAVILSFPSFVHAIRKPDTISALGVDLDPMPAAPTAREVRTAETKLGRSLRLGSVGRSQDALSGAVMNALRSDPSLVGVAALPPLHLDYVTVVPGRNGLADRAYVRFVQRVGGLEVDGSGVTAMLLLGSDGVTLTDLRATLYPELVRSPGSPPSESQGRDFSVSRARGRAKAARVRHGGAKVKWVGGRWRAVRQYDMDDVGLRSVVDGSGQSWVWDERHYARDYTGDAKGRGIRFDPAATGNNLEVLPLADLKFSHPSGPSTYTDASGNFGLYGVADSTGSFSERLTGRWADVWNRNGMQVQVILDGATPNPIAALFNPLGNLEGDTAQVNGYYHTTLTHNWLKARGVDPAGINVPVTVNVNDKSIYSSCNAFYSGSQIYFLPAGGTCRNTAFDTVIYHEYGHFVDDMIGGIPATETGYGLSEGWGDVLASFISRQPLVGEGFFTSGGIIRTADNNYVYNAGDEVHAQGQAWAGFAWHLREGLMSSLGSTAGEALAENLVIPSFWANSPDIPSAVRAVAVADDDDGDLSNGTPHFAQILAAATRHGVAGQLDLQAPSVAITAPASGSTLAGTVLVSGTASDNAAVARVKIFVDSNLIGTAQGVGPWTYVLNTTLFPNGPHQLKARAEDAGGNAAETSILIQVSNTVPVGQAVYDFVRKAPTCGLPGSACDSGALAVGRALIPGGAEPNQPNTLFASCADGTGGTFHSDESLDRVRILALDGGNLTAGKSARVEATVWAFSSYSGDYLDLYHAPNADSPVWTLIATLQPTVAGAQVLSANVLLPEGSTQVLRGNFRYGGAAGPCTGGSYDDRDDLVFAVQSSTGDATAPVVSVSSPTHGSAVRGMVPLLATASDNVGVAGVQFKLDGANLGAEITTAPYAASWNSLLASEGSHTLTAVARDAAGNTATAGAVVVFVDNRAPVLSNLKTVSVTETGAVFAWNTADPAQLHEVDYGTTTAYGTTYLTSGVSTTSHTMTLSGLSRGTTYYYRMKSRDGIYEAWGLSEGRSFQTLTDATPPVISAVSVSMITDTSAQINWATNEPADGWVEYGTSTAYGTGSVPQTALTTTHALGLSGLSTNVVYHYRIRSRDAAGNAGYSTNGTFATRDTRPPVLVVTNPTDGALLSGTTVISGTVSDEGTLSHVTLYIDGRLWKTVSGSGPASLALAGRGPAEMEPAALVSLSSAAWTYAFDTTHVDNGNHLLRLDAVDSLSNSTSVVRNVTVNNGAAVATYSPTLGAPACGMPGAVCSSGGRLEGRGNSPTFPEPNQPNTLLSSPCPDGGTSRYHEFESLDGLKVTALNGQPLTAGQPVRIDARVWAYSSASNSLDLYHAPDASTPTWTWVGTYKPAGARAQVISATMTLPMGGTQQALRGTFRYSGTAGSCTAGIYDDHDDLAFAVDNRPLPPDSVTVSTATGRSLTVSWSAAAGVVTGYRMDVALDAGFASQVPAYADRNLGVVLSTTVTGLSPATTYYIRVRSFNAGGLSLNSPTAVGATLSLPDLQPTAFIAVPAILRPGAPYQLVLNYMNLGSASTGGFSIKMERPGVFERDYFVPNLAPGGTGVQTEPSFAALTEEGDHLIRARVDALNAVDEMDEGNNVVTTTVTVDGTLPTVSIAGLSPNSVVRGTVAVTLSALDNRGLSLVVFSIDGSTVVARSTAPVNPYQVPFVWDTRGYADGLHYIAGQAYDRAGNDSGVSAVPVLVDNANAAQRASVSGAPGAVVVARKPLSVSVGMKNTGTSVWTSTGGYKFQSQNPAGNTVWGPAQASLSANEALAPGWTRYFSLPLVAPSAPGTYALHYRMAKDGLGAFGDDGLNQMVTVVADTVPPSVPLGLTSKGPSVSSFILAWTAATDNAAVAGYRLDVSSVSTFAVLLPGYADLNVGNVLSRTVNGLSAGTVFFVRLRTVDVNGLVSGHSAVYSAATLATPDVTPPTVALTSPAEGAVLTGTSILRATASDNVDIFYVTFLVDGVAQVNDSSLPYEYNWANASVSDGTHTITARARDYAGNLALSTRTVLLAYDRTPPAAPPSPALMWPSVSGLTLSWGSPTDNVGVTGYRIDVASTPAFSPTLPSYTNRLVGLVQTYPISGLAAGTTYYARVRAFDANGNISTHSAMAFQRTLSTTDTTYPTLTILSPTAGSNLSGVVPVQVQATDNVVVTKVAYYLDASTTPLHVQSGPPALPPPFLWDTATVSTGTHILKVSATDSSARTTTRTVSVNVQRVMGLSALGDLPGGPEEPLAVGEVYVYPHPLVGEAGTLHMEVGSADRVKIRIATLSGATVLEDDVTTVVTAPNGHLAHEYRWETRDLASGTYYWMVEAEKGGETVRTVKKIAVVR